MLLLNLCTWEQECLGQGILVCIRWGNMLQLTQHWGTHAKAPVPNVVLIHPRHLGAMCPSWVLQIYNRTQRHRPASSLSFHNQFMFLSQIPQNRKPFLSLSFSNSLLSIINTFPIILNILSYTSIPSLNHNLNPTFHV